MGKRSVAALDGARSEKGPSKKRKADKCEGRDGAAAAADIAPSSSSSQRAAREGDKAARKSKLRGKREEDTEVAKDSSRRSSRTLEQAAERQEQQQTKENAEDEEEETESERADETVCGSSAVAESAEPGGLNDASNGKTLPKKPKKSKRKKPGEEEASTQNGETEIAGDSVSSIDVPAPSVRSSKTEAALLYLRQFVDDRPCWKFQKLKQVWLLKNWHDPTCLSDEDAKRFLAYIEGLKGAQREQLLGEAKNISQEVLPETETATDANNDAESSSGEFSSQRQLSKDERKARRRWAKKVVKVLSQP